MTAFRKKALLALSLSVMALVVLGFTLLSPIPPPLIFQECTRPNYQASSLSSLVAGCKDAESSHATALDSYISSTLWWHKTGLQVAEGLFILAGLSILTLPRMKKVSFSLPRVLKGAALFGASCGFLFFGLLGTIQLLNTNLWAPPTYFKNTRWLKSLDLEASFAAHRTVFSRVYVPRLGVNGLVAFGILAFGVASVTVYRLDKGLWSGLRGAIRCGAAAVTCFEVGLLILAPVYMPTHAIYFAKWSIGGVDVLSNWTVLIVSIGVLMWGVKGHSFRVSIPASILNKRKGSLVSPAE